MLDKLVEDGVVFRADTIEELAEQIGIDPPKFLKKHMIHLIAMQKLERTKNLIEHSLENQ